MARNNKSQSVPKQPNAEDPAGSSADLKEPLLPASAGTEHQVVAAPTPEPPRGDVEAGGPVAEEDQYAQVSWGELVKQFSVLGWIGFGGPAAHIGLFQKRLIEKLGWMPSSVFLELFALGQCLPGPTSTQVSFALGVVKKGVFGGVTSGALFQYPGACMMFVFGLIAARLLKTPPFWVSCAASGVSAVGVSLVASAAKGLLFKLCSTRLLTIIATLSAAAAIYWPTTPGLFPLAIVIGGAVSYLSHRQDDCRVKGEAKDVDGHMGFGKVTGGLLILTWAVILFVLMTLVRTLDYDHRMSANPLDWFEVFYRTGSIIYGGGQVVLPLLLGDLVAQDCSSGHCKEEPVVPEGRSWVSSEQFYTGLGIVQAMPGPLFNFASYLGAVIAFNFGVTPLIGASVAWLGLFFPGVSLMFAVMPFWQVFRKWQVYRRSLDGMNAASVGLILASCFRMTLDVYALSPFPYSALVIGLMSFTCVDQLKIFEPLVVAGGIGLGLLAYAVGAR